MFGLFVIAGIIAIGAAAWYFLFKKPKVENKPVAVVEPKVEEPKVATVAEPKKKRTTKKKVQ